MFQDKSQYKINNNRASKGEKREVDEIHAYSGRSYAKPLTEPLANSKSSLFKPPAYATDHKSKIKKLVFCFTKLSGLIQNRRCNTTFNTFALHAILIIQINNSLTICCRNQASFFRGKQTCFGVRFHFTAI